VVVHKGAVCQPAVRQLVVCQPQGSAAAQWLRAAQRRVPAATAPPAPDAVDPFGAATDVLAAEAGKLPPLTSEYFAQWKSPTAWPPGPELEAAFLRAIGNLTDMSAKPEQVYA
jgi:hypothetical protein